MDGGVGPPLLPVRAGDLVGALKPTRFAVLVAVWIARGSEMMSVAMLLGVAQAERSAAARPCPASAGVANHSNIENAAVANPNRLRLIFGGRIDETPRVQVDVSRPRSRQATRAQPQRQHDPRPSAED